MKERKREGSEWKREKGASGRKEALVELGHDIDTRSYFQFAEFAAVDLQIAWVKWPLGAIWRFRGVENT